MYADGTTVPPEKTRAEIETLLRRYGATSFQTGWDANSATVAFHLKSYTMRFVLPIPGDKAFTFRTDKRSGQKVRNTDNQIEKYRDAEERRRWRALKIVIQAKLEAVDCGISTLVEEFMAFIVVPNGDTFGRWVMDNALPAIQNGRMPILSLPAGPPVVTDNS